MDYTQYFEHCTRADETTYIKLRDDRPEALYTLVYDIHKEFEALPNDWIYSIISQAFDELEDNNIDDITIEPDCYTNDLRKWLQEGYAFYCCDEAMPLGEVNAMPSMSEIVRQGQWYAMDLIYRQVNQWIEEQGEEE